MHIRGQFRCNRVYIYKIQHHIREVDPMIEIELQQETLHTVLDHRNTCNSKISGLFIKSSCVYAY